ncbi:cilia- and flagella-associated protein 74-like isoform X2 [Sitophilus oryzae]|uniref:Cilia- and flagella-associated protein 74-like isoform X2 n=1 Tax=Sitophilus oryzae TaxID=7048 RepID=A0A6J2Y7I4_SITOR|nr:cilia- and flagella-associated protein 74-like isoform X2 [Sitophilus oryzae]
MSYNYCIKYTNTDDNSEKEDILNEAVEYAISEDVKRTQDLYNFIDEFINSEEYLQYITEKRNIAKKNEATQYDLNDINVAYVQAGHTITCSLVEEQKKMHAFKIQFEKFTERQKNLQKIKNQENGIKIIKEKIQAAKQIFECSKDNQAKKLRNINNKLLNKYTKKLNIDLYSFKNKAQAEVLERLRNLERHIYLSKKRRQENLTNILRKLVNEQQAKKLEKRPQVSVPKIRDTERIINNMEIVGTKIELICGEEIENQEIISSSKDVINEADKQTISTEEKTKMKTTKKPGALKEQNKNTTQDKENKEKKKSKKELKEPRGKHQQFELPVIPVINPRSKVLPENTTKLLDLIEEFQNFDAMLEDTEICKKGYDSHGLKDYGLLLKQNEVIFKNYDTHKSYSKSIRITNVSTETRKLRFLKFWFEDSYDQLLFKIHPLGIKKLYPGCTALFYIHFSPYDSSKSYNGKIFFCSYNTRRHQYHQLEVNLNCLPKFVNLQILPNTINFGKIPIWKAGYGKSFKTIKFINRGTKPCKLHVKKIQDDLEIEDNLKHDNSRNIDENLKSQKKTLNGITENDENYECIRFILDLCLENIGNTFEFECTRITLKAAEEKKIKVHFKKPSYIGNYSEKFSVDVYEDVPYESLNILCGCQEITVFAETVGPFISVKPILLDFGTCLVNSCYKLCFEVFNNSNNSQAISIRIPQDLCDMFEVNVSTIYLASQSSRVMWLKFFVCDYMLKSNFSYFCKSTSILEFYIHLQLVSKNYLDYPPLKIPVYAIVTNSDELDISAISTENINNFLNTIMVDLGTCSIYETVYTDIYLTNSSSATQTCGFFNLPDEISSKKLQGSFDMMLSEIVKKDTELIQSMIGFVANIKKTLSATPWAEFFEIQEAREEKTLQTDNETKVDETTQCNLSALNIQNFVILETSSRKDIWLKVNLKRPLVELSHQLVEFPDTPCGSYSTMEIFLNMIRKRMELECETLNKKTKHKENITIRFNISSDNSEISVEPRCGIIKTGQSIKLTLLANPLIPKDILDQTAKSIKYQELYEMKLNEFKASQGKKYGKQNKNKSKKLSIESTKSKGTVKSKESENSKKGKKTTTPKKKIKNEMETDKKDAEEEPVIVIPEKDLEYSYLDLFPAEMVYWRNMEPYYIKANFICKTVYENDDTIKEFRLYFQANCRVVQPDFITNLNLQRIDFGRCAVGGSIFKIITLQNIKYHSIQLRTSLLDPLGSFSITCVPKFKVPAEHFLNLPLKFSPHAVGQVNEYFEIRTKSTILPLILSGQAVPINVNIIPEVTFFRLEVKGNRLAELQLKISNLSEVEVTLRFIKLFEIVNNPEDISSKNEDLIDKIKNKNDKKDKKEKGPKGTKFSNDITDLEITTIRKNFSKSEEPSHFCLNQTGNYSLEPNSQNTVTIFFGTPELLEKRKMKKTSEKQKKGEKNTNTSGETESIKSEEQKKPIAVKKQYITQYNIFAGNIFLKNIVLICDQN